LCIDTLDGSYKPIGLYSCKSPNNLTKIEYRQYFILRQHRDIVVENSNSECFDVNYGKVNTMSCAFQQGDQYFRYNIDTFQIFSGPLRYNQCIDSDVKKRTVFLARCNETKRTQKWRWGFVNETMVRNWTVYGKRILDLQELKDMGGKVDGI
jgi:polypeptide N-acetylgalactosaminyltransferase